MKHGDFERLAWQRIDGAISPEDGKRLEGYLEEYPEARTELDDLVALAELLSAVEQDPPTHLRPRIDRAVAATRPSWPQRAVSRRSATLLSLWGPRLAYLAAGLLIGAVVTHLLQPGREPAIEDARVVGAMRIVPSTGAIEIDLGEGIGTLDLRRDGYLLRADLGLVGELAVELVLETDQGRLQVRSASHTGGRESVVVADEETVVLRAHGPGRHLLSLEPDQDPATVRVRAVSEGRVLLDRTLELAGG
jgi:hypothetical protein